MPEIMIGWILPVAGTLLGSGLVWLLKNALNRVTSSITGMHDQVNTNATNYTALRELAECIDVKLDEAVKDNKSTHKATTKELRGIRKEMKDANGRTSKLEGSVSTILHYQVDDHKKGTS